MGTRKLRMEEGFGVPTKAHSTGSQLRGGASGRVAGQARGQNWVKIPEIPEKRPKIPDRSTFGLW